MAQLIASPQGSGPQGEFERKVVETLVRELPSSFKALPNFKIKQSGHPALEYDVALLTPHAVFVLEAREWYGRLTGDDTEWLINSSPRKCPLWLVDTKCKVLKSKVGLHGMNIRFEPLLVVPNDRCQIQLEGEWAGNVFPLREAIRFVQVPRNVPRAGYILGHHPSIVQQIQGSWSDRRRDVPRRIAGYEVIETISVQDGEAEYLAKRALIRDTSLFRVRTWPLNPYLAPEETEQRELVIRRPVEALAQIGRHANLLQILAFDKLEDEHEFYEITEWSEYGTLHGFLKNASRDQLTLRERFTIALGVASALEAVHAKAARQNNLSNFRCIGL
jgi:Nuclease-related domain